MNVTQTYKPGDTFLEYVTVPADASVVATLWRNGSSVGAGVSVSSPVVDQQCTISFDIPSEWSAGDIIVVQLRGTSEEEGLDEPETYKFQLEAQTLSEVGTLAKQEEILSAIDGIEGGALPEETIEKIDDIHSHFNYLAPEQPAIVLPAPTNPNMTKIAVFLRGDSGAPLNGEEVTITMYEKGNIYIDGAYLVKKQYTKISGIYTDANEVVHSGVAVFDVYDSEKLELEEYNPLYEVVGTGLERDLWVVPGGGDIGEMPTAKPEESE